MILRVGILLEADNLIAIHGIGMDKGNIHRFARRLMRCGIASEDHDPVALDNKLTRRCRKTVPLRRESRKQA